MFNHIKDDLPSAELRDNRELRDWECFYNKGEQATKRHGIKLQSFVIVSIVLEYFLFKLSHIESCITYSVEMHSFLMLPQRKYVIIVYFI